MKSKMQKFSLTKKGNTNKNSHKKDFKKIQDKRRKKKENDDAEIESLSSRLWPNFGEETEEVATSSLTSFSQLPISKKTLEGLKAHNFITLTDIQRESLLFGLKGRDILGAAKTGSGKTLAFLIPILETLFRQRYTPSFGMAALVISPTRELAYQTFDVLRKISKFHDFSAGLVTGGMELKREAHKINTTNVVVCTPGRLQQHFEQTPNFTADEVKVLVLDEADKILHMGFADTLNAIVQALPKQRQTLLFSATQTKSVKDLVRLSLKKPVYVSVHEKSEHTTPTKLEQAYIVCKMQDKVNALWSFIRTHRHTKMLVFMSCCKEVRYLYHVFKKMHPGLTILCLHGHMKQHQRMEVYESFSRKQHAVLLATDVAARGLDFPVVSWVIQMDKPENVNTYIHRVGRTARYEKVGQALLMLLPSEEKKMVEDLHKRKIPIKRLKVRQNRMMDVTKKLESLCASDKDLKESAQKALISVMKTIYVLDKATFQTVDLEAFAASLGLVQVPKLSFLEKTVAKSKAKVDKKPIEQGSDDDSDAGDNVTSDSEEESEESDSEDKQILNPADKATLDFGVNSEDDDTEGDIYSVVRNSKRGEEEVGAAKPLMVFEEGTSSKKKSRAKERLKLLKYTTRIMFDEEGNPENKEESDDDDGGLNIKQAQERMKEQDKLDKEEHRRRVKEQHREKRLKLKEKRRQIELEKRKQSSVDTQEVVLGSPDYEEGNDENNSSEDGVDEFEEDNAEPKAKRQKLASDENSEDSEDVNGTDEKDNSEDEDSEVEEEEEDNNEDERNEDSDESEVDAHTIGQDEAAVLALLGGKR